MNKSSRQSPNRYIASYSQEILVRLFVNSQTGEEWGPDQMEEYANNIINSPYENITARRKGRRLCIHYEDGDDWVKVGYTLEAIKEVMKNVAEAENLEQLGVDNYTHIKEQGSSISQIRLYDLLSHNDLVKLGWLEKDDESPELYSPTMGLYQAKELYGLKQKIADAFKNLNLNDRFGPNYLKTPLGKNLVSRFDDDDAQAVEALTDRMGMIFFQEKAVSFRCPNQAKAYIDFGMHSLIRLAKLNHYGELADRLQMIRGPINGLINENEAVTVCPKDLLVENALYLASETNSAPLNPNQIFLVDQGMTLDAFDSWDSKFLAKNKFNPILGVPHWSLGKMRASLSPPLATYSNTIINQAEKVFSNFETPGTGTGVWNFYSEELKPLSNNSHHWSSLHSQEELHMLSILGGLAPLINRDVSKGDSSALYIASANVDRVLTWLLKNRRITRLSEGIINDLQSRVQGPQFARRNPSQKILDVKYEEE